MIISLSNNDNMTRPLKYSGKYSLPGRSINHQSSFTQITPRGIIHQHNNPTPHDHHDFDTGEMPYASPDYADRLCRQLYGTDIPTLARRLERVKLELKDAEKSVAEQSSLLRKLKQSLAKMEDGYRRLYRSYEDAMDALYEEQRRQSRTRTRTYYRQSWS